MVQRLAGRQGRRGTRPFHDRGRTDDLYATARHERLSPAWDGDVPRLALWAPTAQAVTLNLYDTSRGGPATVVPMWRDDTTGIWTVTGGASWRYRYYTFAVTVYAPEARDIVVNEVTDPYSLSLAADSARSQLVDLNDPAIAPPGWPTLRKPPAVRQDQASIYELHVRDFSASDGTVAPELRGTFAAFTVPGSAGMRALRGLADDGLTHVQIMPAFDFAAAPESRAERQGPPSGLAELPPDSG